MWFVLESFFSWGQFLWSDWSSWVLGDYLWLDLTFMLYMKINILISGEQKHEVHATKPDQREH